MYSKSDGILVPENILAKFLIMKAKSISELRRDVVSGDWVVIATARAHRPDEFSKHRQTVFHQPKKICPFEKVSSDTLLVHSLDGGQKKDNWWVQVKSNKYPAFGKGLCSVFHHMGPYESSEGVGFHEVVFTRDHERTIAGMSDEETELVLRAYQERYKALKDDACVEYVSIFHNQGRLSGASISHPHSQIIAIPVIPPDVARSLDGSFHYFHKHNACVHCMIVNYELREKIRIVYENKSFVVVAPYASKTAFEMRVFPKQHSAHFEEIADHDRLLLANAFRIALAKLSRGLKNPDLNFFLHTAPTADSSQFNHYHWHFEILPKTTIWAGFEIGTGIDITTITPEAAAAFLKKIKIS